MNHIIRKFCKLLRNICTENFLLNSKNIDVPNCTVQNKKVLICKRKYNRGRFLSKYSLQAEFVCSQENLFKTEYKVVLQLKLRKCLRRRFYLVKLIGLTNGALITVLFNPFL